VLATVVRERSRVLAPALLASILVYMAVAPWLGIRRGTGVVAFEVAVCVLLGGVSLMCWRRQVPVRWSHAVSAFIWWCPVSVTFMAQYTNHEVLPSVLLGAEIVAVGVLLHTRIVIGSLVGATALAVPLAIREGSRTPGVFLFSIVVACMFALLIHALMRHVLLRAEEHRLSEVEAQHQRNLLNEQLLRSQRMDAVGRLAGGIAHDMNNILGAITNVASVALDDVDHGRPVDVVQRRADLVLVLAQAAHGAALTRSLLAFGRRGQYRKQVVLIAEVMGEILSLLARTLPKSIEIIDRIEVGDARVDGDPLHLQQAVLNLAVNAAEAMRRAGALAITATLVEVNATSAIGLPPGRYVRIVVADNGIGMDAETRRRAFEPFFTTKPVGEGKGLGLSTVWGIAEAHGGGVEIESELGRGSTFSLMLPLTDATLAAPRKRSSSKPIVHQGTVLVVDDDAAVRRGTRRILERMGFDVLVAGDGAEALRVFAGAAKIDLVVLDMGMPVMGGAECFAQLRTHSDVPILVATGYAVDAEAQSLVAAGAGILEKPFVSADLAREVTRMLHPRRDSSQVLRRSNTSSSPSVS
jgi:signal transduction histidine kinase/CheY-like chemotaxis protein